MAVDRTKPEYRSGAKCPNHPWNLVNGVCHACQCKLIQRAATVRALQRYLSYVISEQILTTYDYDSEEALYYRGDR